MHRALVRRVLGKACRLPKAQRDVEMDRALPVWLAVPATFPRSREALRRLEAQEKIVVKDDTGPWWVVGLLR